MDTTRLQRIQELLHHGEPSLEAQGLVLVWSLSRSEQRAILRAEVALPWQPGLPWRVLLLAAAQDARAELALRAWSLMCLAQAGCLLPPTVDWRGLLRAGERFQAGQITAADLQNAVLHLGQIKAPPQVCSAEGLQIWTAWRALLVAAEDLAATPADRSGGWRAPAILERLRPGWGRRALLTHAVACLLDRHHETSAGTGDGGV